MCVCAPGRFLRGNLWDKVSWENTFCLAGLTSEYEHAAALEVVFADVCRPHYSQRGEERDGEQRRRGQRQKVEQPVRSHQEEDVGASWARNVVFLDSKALYSTDSKMVPGSFCGQSEWQWQQRYRERHRQGGLPVVE